MSFKSNPSDFSKSRFNAVPSHFPQHSPASPGLIGRFKDMVFRRLTPQDDGVSRVPELQHAISEVSEDLKNLKDRLQKSLKDVKVLNSVNAVIDKEVESIKKIAAQIEQPKDQKRALEEYHQWNSKVRPWITLLSEQARDPSALKHVVVRYTIQSSIEGDLQFIRRYLHQETEKLTVPDEEQRKLGQRLEEELAEPLKLLNDLRHPPQALSVEQLESWKMEVYNDLRQKYNNEALKIIDKIVQGVSAVPDPVQVQHDSVSLSQIVHLEESVPRLLELVRAFQEKSLGNFTEVEREELQELKDALGILEDQLRLLEQDLLLHAELVDRLDTLRSQLHTAKQILSA